MTSVNFGFISNVTVLINYLDYRYLQDSNESWYSIEFAAHFFLLTPYVVTKTSSFVLQTLIVIALIG